MVLLPHAEPRASDFDTLYTSRALGETHRRYCRVINARMRVTGHLFQSRFGSVATDEDYLMAALRYVALNPVRAGLVIRAQDWNWSSVQAHLAGKANKYVRVEPVLERCEGRFSDMLETAPDARYMVALRASETIGRPLGSDAFLNRIAVLTWRDARPAKRGRKTV